MMTIRKLLWILLTATLFVACTKDGTKGGTTDDNKRKVNATANDYTENGNQKHFIRLGLSAGDEPEKTSEQDYIYPDHPCFQVEHESTRVPDQHLRPWFTT